MHTIISAPNVEAGTPSRRGRAAVTVRPKVLIGPMSSDPTESVSCVNAAFVKGLEDQYDFLPLDATRRYGNTRQTMVNAMNLFYFAQQLLRWVIQLCRHRPQLSHYAISSGCAMEKGLVFMKVARLAGVKTLGHIHAGDFIEHWQSLGPWRKRFALREFSRLDGLVLASQWWCEQVRKYLPLPPDRFFVVHNPIDISFEQLALQMPIERPGNTVLSLGVMERAKGVFDILTAAKSLTREVEFHLQLVGAEREPNVLNNIREQIAAHSLAEVVQVKPAVSNAEKIELFRNASILLLPSYFENMPLVLVEAAAAGLAIVTTPVGAVPEFLQHGVSAFFVEPGHPEQIAQALLRLLRHPEERRRLGLAAREAYLKHLASSRSLASLDRVYRRVLCAPDLR
jgi:glycosyltransferase involved in cell wall biosynthesis